MTQYDLKRVKSHLMLKPIRDIRCDIEFNNPEEVVSELNRIFDFEKFPEEYIYLIATNTRNKPTALFEISHGSIDMAILDTRTVYARLLLVGASKALVFHNHPSGCPQPSEHDMELYECLNKCGKIMKIPLLDFLIVGDNGSYYSQMETNDYVKREKD